MAPHSSKCMKRATTLPIIEDSGTDSLPIRFGGRGTRNPMQSSSINTCRVPDRIQTVRCSIRGKRTPQTAISSACYCHIRTCRGSLRSCPNCRASPSSEQLSYLQSTQTRRLFISERNGNFRRHSRPMELGSIRKMSQEPPPGLQGLPWLHRTLVQQFLPCDEACHPWNGEGYVTIFW